MSTTKNGPSPDEVMEFLSRAASDTSGKNLNAAFCFLYKEILLNRIMIMESGQEPNRAGIEHNEKLVNDLNMKLMRHMK